MQTPYRVAEETFILPSYVTVPGFGLGYLNPMLIRGSEPILVDVSSPVHRAEYLDALFKLVEPKDVRWIYLSHDDRDHSGNIMQLLDQCPNATVVTNFVTVARMSTEWQLPLNRMRWVNEGESWRAGDRTLVAVTPPLFDSPATHGLWDAKTRLYYAADCFGSLVPAQCQEIGDVAKDAWEYGFKYFNRVNHPWHEFADPRKLQVVIDRIRDLKPKTIVTYHGPHGRDRTDELLRLIAEVIAMERLPLPTQKDLEAMLAARPPSTGGRTH